MRFAMGKALGYYGKTDWFKNNQSSWTGPNTFPKKKKECDPDAMDIDRTQLDPAEKEKLLKSGSCFQCKKQGHLSRECPLKKDKGKAAISEATTEPTPPTKKKGKVTQSSKDKPPSYDSLAKQISACSMEDWQKLLESLSNFDEDDNQDF